MLRYTTGRARPGLVAFYDIRSGNGVGLFIQPENPHGASSLAELKNISMEYGRRSHCGTNSISALNVSLNSTDILWNAQRTLARGLIARYLSTWQMAILMNSTRWFIN